MSVYNPPISDASAVMARISKSPFAPYENWVQHNQGWIRSVEDSLRTMVLFLPGRFGDAEVRSQTIYTAVDLLSFYHDCILNRPRVSLQLQTGIEESTEIKTVKALLSAVQYTEVLIEMIATRKLTRNQRWLLISLIEAIKSLSRLFLLFRNRGHMLLLGCSDPSAEEPAIIREAAAGNLPADVPYRDLLQMYAQHGRGIHNPHGYFVDAARPPRPPPIPVASPSSIAAEVLHFLRPSIYAVTRYLTHDSSWLPFLLSLGMDVSSRMLIGKMEELTRPQQEEVARRMMLWAYYLLRSPFFETITKTPLSMILGFLGKIPLFGVIFGNLFDLALELQTHYFYISASSP